MASQLAMAIASGLGLGFLPKAPGTFGSLLGVILGYSLGQCSVLMNGLACISIFGVGLWAIEKTKGRFSKVDASQIVIDEVFGMFLSQIALPKTFGWLCASFLVFRCFDISKPPGVRYFDAKVKNSLGVMLDDGMAGLYTLLILQGLRYFAF